MTFSLGDQWPGVESKVVDQDVEEFPDVGDCPATGKIRFKYRQQAMKKLQELIRKDPAEIMCVYKCKFCGRWHTGHVK